jgi:hypothetical protein
LPPNEHSRCLAPACISFLLRIPHSWWQRVVTEEATALDRAKFPLIGAILDVAFSGNVLSGALANDVYRKFLEYNDGAYNSLAEAPACLGNFFRETVKLGRANANLNPGELVVIGEHDTDVEHLKIGVYTLTAILPDPVVRRMFVAVVQYNNRA